MTKKIVNSVNNCFFFLDCLEDNYKTEKNKFKTVFVCIVAKLFLSVILNVHTVLEYLLKDINSDVCIYNCILLPTNFY